MIQLRDKRLDDRELVDRARQATTTYPQARRLCALSTTEPISRRQWMPMAFIVGQEDLSVKDARAIVGPRMLIGVSTHNIEQARAAVLDGANYLGAGPTFASNTKAFDAFAGLEYLREVSSEIRLPTFAIGGIAAGNLADVLAAGISRVAVGGGGDGGGDPGCAARELLGMLEWRTMH